MATDPQLPEVLMSAALGVGLVGDQVQARARQGAAVVSSSTEWRGSSARQFKTVFRSSQSRDFNAVATMVEELEAALRRAAKSASQRLYWEEQERLRKAREAAAAKKGAT